MDLDLAAARRAAEQAALTVAPALIEAYGAAPVAATKSEKPSDVVTALDLETEHRLAELLGAFDSGISFRGEEFGGDEHAETTWLVDPIDGTAHFVRGIPWCCTMISLIDRGDVVLSVVNCFAVGELYSAANGLGATCNGDRIRVSDRALDDSYLVVDTDLRDSPERAELYGRLQQRAGLLQVIASGYAHVLTASGRVDGRLGIDAMGWDWDYAGAAPLIREAGGIVTNIGSDTFDYRDHSFLAANPRVHAALTEGPDALFSIG